MIDLQNEQKDDFYKDIRSIIEDIRVNFLFMTKEVLMKTNRFINKQIIDSIKNYFFENQIGTLLKPKMEKDSLKKVKSEIEDNIKCDPENRYQDPDIPKYMIFMNAYVDQIEKYSLHQDYLNLLYDLILSDNQSKGFSDDWMTLIRKKITAVLLLGHFQSANRQNLKNIFDLWANVYPNQQLNKVKKNFKNSKQTANQVANEETEKHVSSSDSDNNSETEDQEVVQEQIKQSKQNQSKLKNLKYLKTKTKFQQTQLIEKVLDLDISMKQYSQENIEKTNQKDDEIQLIKPASNKQTNNRRKIQQKKVSSSSKKKQETKLEKELETSKKKQKKQIKSEQNEYQFNQDEFDETSYSPLMQGAQAEIYVAETQFILDHEEDDEEEEEEENEDDGEETNPQNYIRHVSIIPAKAKIKQQVLQKSSGSKIIVKQRKTQKILKQKQKKQIQVQKEKIVALDQNQTSLNDEKTTSIRQYSLHMQQNYDQPQLMQSKDPEFIYQDELKNHSEKSQQNDNGCGIFDEQNLYFQQYNYSLLSSQINENKINSQYYNCCYNYSDQQQILFNVNGKNQNQNLQKNALQQQNFEISTKNESNNQLLYNNITTTYTNQVTNQNSQTVNNLANISYFSNQTNLNNQETDLQSNFTNYFNYNNNNSHFIQSNNQKQQNSYIYENIQKEESQEIMKHQQFSPQHFSDQDTVQHKNQHHDTFSQEYQDYLNFDHDIQNQNICYSICDFNAYDNYKNFYKEIEYSQDLKIEMQKCSPNNVFNNQFNLNEDQQQLNQQNNQIQLEIQQNNNKEILEYDKQFEINNQSTNIKQKSKQIWKNLLQKVEDKTEITISQDQQQDDDIEDSISSKSSKEDVYKDTISIDDQDDELLTQSF